MTAPRRPDAELDELFVNEPELRATADRLRAARPDPELDPRFKAVLRARLMREAESTQALRRRRWFRVGHVAWGSASLAAAGVAALVLTLVAGHVPGGGSITVSSPLQQQHAVATTDVITVSFNQSMDEHTVQTGVHIQPATAVTYSWSADGRTLQIHPQHQLAGNTPYVITIDHSSVRSSNGQTVDRDVHITFGTAPSPMPSATPSSSPVPALTPVTVGPVSGHGAILVAPDGTPGDTAGILPAPPSPSPSATVSPSTSGSPSASPSPSATAAPATITATASYPASGPVRLGEAAPLGAWSPSGRLLATTVPRTAGGSDLVVVHADGTGATVLHSTDTAIRSLTWTDDSTILFAAGGEISSVDLTHRVIPLMQLAASDQAVVLAPGGASAYLGPVATTETPAAQPAGGPSPDGTLVDLHTQHRLSLPGSRDGVVFSGDGSTVAWVDPAGALHVATADPDTASPRQVTTAGGGVTLLALSRDGALVAYDGDHGLVVARVADGGAVATGPQLDAAKFDGNTTHLYGLLSGGDGTLLVALDLPASASTPAPTAGNGIPASAEQMLERLLSAQVAQDANTLGVLAAQGTDVAGATPPNVSRGYVITASTASDGSVHAVARLIRDPAAGQSTTYYSDETLTLIPGTAKGSWLVGSITVPPLTAEASGPHVVHATGVRSGGQTVLTITFDSDLDPQSIDKAIQVLAPDGSVLKDRAQYDATSRTVTVVVAGAPSGSLTLQVGTGLLDINGQALAAPFSSTITL